MTDPGDQERGRSAENPAFSDPLQMTAFDEPVARTDDPRTSWDAAASVDGLTDKRRAVLACLKRIAYGSTDYQWMALYRSEWEARGWPKQSESGLRTRRAELVAAKLVEDSGKRRRLPSGRRAIVWRVVA